MKVTIRHVNPHWYPKLDHYVGTDVEVTDTSACFAFARVPDPVCQSGWALLCLVDLAPGGWGVYGLFDWDLWSQRMVESLQVLLITHTMETR